MVAELLRGMSDEDKSLVIDTQVRPLPRGHDDVLDPAKRVQPSAGGQRADHERSHHGAAGEQGHQGRQAREVLSSPCSG